MTESNERFSIDTRLAARRRRLARRDAPAWTWTSVQVATLALVIAAHVSADVLILSQRLALSPSPFRFALFSIPLAQSALVTQAAMRPWAKSYVRFTAAMFAALCCWTIVLKMMAWGLRDTGGASMAWGFVLQSSIILLAHPIVHGRSLAVRRYGIASMMGWLTVAAIVLALLRRGPLNWEWNTDTIMWQFFLLMPVVCLGTGLVAVIVDAALTLARPSWQRALLFVFGIAGVTVGVPVLVATLWDSDLMSFSRFASMVATVSVLVLATHVSLRRVASGDRTVERYTRVGRNG